LLVSIGLLVATTLHGTAALAQQHTPMGATAFSSVAQSSSWQTAMTQSASTWAAAARRQEGEWNIGRQRSGMDSRTAVTVAALPDSDSPILEFAATLLGRRYRYGASRGEFDCSGFVKRVYQEFGVDLPHSSREQFGLGERVPREDLQPGDLVFFRNGMRGPISHVGIYAGGDDLFLHAARKAGRVRIDTLNESYFATRYAGARRLCSAPSIEC
jgi:cell wall-associated NlpC family hydrolase